MKKQAKITAREINEMEINNSSDKEFKVMIIKILTGLEKTSGALNKEIKKYKNEAIRDEKLND